VKIAVYAISKNEEQFVERFCSSASDADLVLIADTGSTDATVELAEAFGAAVYDITITPFRFDLARNAALALVPRDIDVCVSLDLDEVLEPGWRAEIERVWVNGATRMRYSFDWSKGVVFKSDKIHARSGYHWHHPCHETLRADPRLAEVWADTDTLLVRHLPDDTKSRAQYLDLLEVASTEDPHCPRNAIYHARELVFVGRWADADKALDRYLAMDNVWHGERSYALRLKAKAARALGCTEAIEPLLKRAAAEAPECREPHIDLAEHHYICANWQGCLMASKQALSIFRRPGYYTDDPRAWGSLPYDLAAIASWHLGMFEDARVFGLAATQLDPSDTRLASNLHFYLNHN
jgi:hypothetical protein